MRIIGAFTFSLVLIVAWLHLERVEYGKQYGKLFSIFKGGGKRYMFSDRYHKNIEREWSCLSPTFPFELLTDSNRLNADRIRIRFLQTIFNDFTVLNNQSQSNNVSIVYTITLLNNRPIVLTIKLIEERGNWVIDDIGNMCELLTFIKRYKNFSKENKICTINLP
jgi:hypothetical protein